MLKLTLILLLCTGVFAQIPSGGNCPKVKYVQNFSITNFTGSWYEFAKYLKFIEIGWECGKTTLSYTNDVIYFQTSKVSSLTGSIYITQGTAKQIGKKGEAKFSVTYPSAPLHFKHTLFILDVEYDKYAVVYMCKEFGFFHTINAWILTKDRFPTEEVLESAYQAFDANNLSRTHLVNTTQEDCNYYDTLK